MAFNIQDNTGVLIKKAARLFERVANKDLDKLGVTYAQTIFLVRLWERDGQSQAELATSAGLKQPTAVRLLDRMEKDELITRVRNPEDRRIFNFFLTAKAKKACKKLEAHAVVMKDISNQAIPDKDIEKLNQLIKRVIHNLQNHLDNS